MFTTFILGIYGLVSLKDVDNWDSDDEGNYTGNNGDEESTDPKISFNVFTYTMPFVAFVLDHSTKRL